MSYTKSNPNGQATSANSTPIVIASDQPAILITGTINANIGTSGSLSTSAKQDLLLAELQLKADLTETQPVSVITLPLPIGAATSANQQTDALTNTQLRAAVLPVSLTSTTITNIVSANATLSAETTKIIGTVNVAGTVPISGALTDSQIRATPLPISGSITSNIGTTNGLALDSTLTSGTQKSVVRGGNKGTTISADVTSTIVDVNTQALDVFIKGTPTVAVNNFPASQAVTGTFFQTTQPISGTVTANTGLSQPLTDTQLRATALPISGTVVTGGLTDTQIRATALPISGTITSNIGTTNGLALDATINTLLKPASTLAAITSITNAVTIKADTLVNQVNALKTDSSATTQPISASTLPLPTGSSTSALQTTGNTSLGSIDTKLPTGLTVTANRLQVELPAGSGGLTNTELRATPVFISGTVSTGLSQPLTDTQIRATALPVSGTFFQATQPVSLATNTPVIAAGTASIGNINELRAGTLAVTGTAAAGTALTITLPAVAAQFHYITSITIVLYSSAARTGAAAPNVVTTTNIPGAVAFTFSTAGAIGATDSQDLSLVTPLKSTTVNTATTIVAPIAAGGIWRITATYFTGT